MSGTNIKLVGLDKLQVKLKKCQNLDAVKKVVKKNGVEMQAKTVRNAVFGNYSTGATKRSIKGKSEDDGLSYREGPTTYYSGYVELGTRKMSAQPFVKPAFDAQKGQFKKDLNKLMK